MDIRMDEDTSVKIAQGISKTYHEVLLSMKFLQTKSHVRNKNINYYDLYYTVIKNRDEKEIVGEQYEKNGNDHFGYEDFITPNHNISSKPRETILK